jgi:hypothetical protein
METWKDGQKKGRNGSGTASQRVKYMKYNRRSNQVRLKVKRVLLEWSDHVLAEVEGRNQPILGYLDGSDLLVPGLQSTKGVIINMVNPRLCRGTPKGLTV